MNSLTIGHYEQEIVAALAYDLAARVVGMERSDYSFSEKRLKQLVRQYGGEVVEGLNEKLPKRLREDIVNLVKKMAG